MTEQPNNQAVPEGNAPSILTPEQTQMVLRLTSILTPTNRRRIDGRYPNRNLPARFVHYTSAENALKIIRTKRLWMRSTFCMAAKSHTGAIGS